MAAHFAKRNTKFGGGGKIGIGKRGRAKIPSPQPPSFLPARAFRAAISRSFVQKRFELRSVIATNSDILKIERHLVARKKPCISELNRKGGQIQIQFFGKANDGSELRSNSQMKFVSNFFRFLPKAKTQSKFLISRFWSKTTNN
ncbi:MAG: hypothetical protein UX56_C0006G0004 [Candidatus Azambacteria bacterium GW2011_GWD2_46_48]|uniref:Uncharacterized protein n=1 Tax=Candidatus Azambacteria bacterium GW2011_GWD2_46_48 TaxID=1618623 RepID=A0A0G1TBI3_9BACT|nr:MAG: hypothetical protein UX56_C0006G0004 [Candidatus Azambacteria bacterium GW2011_GWD2_46_48]